MHGVAFEKKKEWETRMKRGQRRQGACEKEGDTFPRMKEGGSHSVAVGLIEREKH